MVIQSTVACAYAEFASSTKPAQQSNHLVDKFQLQDTFDVGSKTPYSVQDLARFREMYKYLLHSMRVIHEC